MPSYRPFLTVLLLLAPLAVAQAAPPPARDFVPDPASVQRAGTGYRYPQDGWIVLHIEGKPYERGYQHGTLLAPEIVEYIKALATSQSPRAPADGWRDLRLLCNALFLRRYEKEYLEEMKGIADGAAGAGAKYQGQPLDLLDIVTVNSSIEVDFLEANLRATPTGLEGQRFKEPPFARPVTPPPAHCSAFAATGPATADGKIVFGHITMFGLYHVRHFNVWLDIKPEKGHRVLMQSYPGSIMSGMDYYLNDAGLLVAETTIAQTRFDSNGTSMVSRIRQAVQYGGSIDEAVKILGKDSNGVYTNEWLLADIKTNEIAMFELGTHKSKLWRSSKDEWFGDTKGFYWGCNNAKDLDVRLETIASVEGKPANLVFRPSARDRTWLRLYDKYKGKIGLEFGFEAFTTPPIAAFPSCDAKFTTTALAKDLKTWALFGPPLGRTWDPTEEERTRYADIRPLVSNDWTVLHGRGPAASDIAAVDRPRIAVRREREEENDESIGTMPPAWHGTILPKTDQDIWLATAFADYERIVALEKALQVRARDGKLRPRDQDRLDVALFGPYSRYRAALARLDRDVPEGETRADLRRSEWYDIAAGRGVLLLAGLRNQMGGESFDKFMDEFGRANAGKQVTGKQFYEQLKKGGIEAASIWSTDSKTSAFRDRMHALGFWSIDSFAFEPEQALIVYGTARDQHAQREAAELLQQRIRRLRTESATNSTVPIKADRDVTDQELKTHHLLLIGRPETNSVTARCAAGLPVSFGPGSFVLGKETYGNPGSAVIIAGGNALNSRRYSAVVFAGLSAEATRDCVQRLSTGRAPLITPVLLLAAGERPRAMVVPMSEKAAAAAPDKTGSRR